MESHKKKAVQYDSFLGQGIDIGETMGAYLKKPITQKVSKSTRNKAASCYGSTMQGWRISQEDSFNCLTNFDGINTDIFSVFDGHGGAGVSRYCSLYLADFIRHHDEYQSGNFENALKTAFLDFDQTLRLPKVVEKLRQLAKEEIEHSKLCVEIDKQNFKLQKSFEISKRTSALTMADIKRRCGLTQFDSSDEFDSSSDSSSESSGESDSVDTQDEVFLIEFKQDDNDAPFGESQNNSPNNEEIPGVHSGTTALVCLLRQGRIHVANVGDSRCVVCTEDGQAIDMSKDHKPDEIEETRRIEQAGGRVTRAHRVNDDLNLSRALGDHFYKTNSDLNQRDQIITALPDVRTFPMSGNRFMVLATDGIWNSMSSQKVVDIIRTRLDGGDSVESACNHIFDKCLASDKCQEIGCDNMTCVIVIFN